MWNVDYKETRNRLTRIAADILVFKYEVASRKYKATTVSVACPQATSHILKRALTRRGFQVSTHPHKQPNKRTLVLFVEGEYA